ncbi:MAG: T9SS type A sorting domain-containing protein [Cytophagaceae bacterium]|nr:T9SS type A sorting domain-containing protein [Cytophagaceae bacterium]
MKKKLLEVLSIVFVCFGFITFGQIDPYEATGPITIVPVDDFNKVEYDKCTGVLNFGLEATRSGTNGTWPIMKMLVYVKVGPQWRLMTTIRGVAAGLNTATEANTGSSNSCAGGLWNGSGENVITDACWTPGNYGSVTTNTLTGENPPNDFRISYASGAFNNYYWASWVDHNICQTYNANADLINPNAPMYLLAYSSPPRMYGPHTSNIPGNLTAISFYPSNGSEWGIQFGVANIPAEAINGGVVNIRVYKHTRSMCCLNSTDPANNAYQVLEFATNVNSVDAPFGLTATSNQCNQVTLNWQNPTQTWSSAYNCTNNQTYKNIIYRDGVKIALIDGDLSQYIDNSAGLVQRQTYNYTVRKLLWNRDAQTYRVSSSSNVATGSMKLPPAQPSPLSATNDKCNTVIDLTWSQPNGTAVNQYTFIAPTFTTTLSSSARNYSWSTNVVRGTNYQIKLVATNDCGYPSDTASVIGISPADPLIATDVTATVNPTYDTVTVTWTDNANNETKYQIQRQDNLGNVVTFDVNPNVTSYKDWGIVPCRSYNYSVKAFNSCVQSGLVSATVSTPAIPPPNLNTTFTSTKKLICSKGYFTNRVELSWQNNNGQNIDIFRIYRKIIGTSLDSTLVGTANTGSGFFVDNTADARVYYKYTIVAIKYCNGSDIASNTSEDIGFRNPTGLVSGHIEYNGGIALTGAKVLIQSSGTAVGSSIQFANGDSLILETPSTLSLLNKIRIEFWFKPTSYAPSQNIVQKTGVFSFAHSGSNYVATVNIGGIDRTISVPESNFPLNVWKHVSIQYLGDSSAYKLFANGILVGASSIANANVANVNNSIVFGGSNSEFLLDEFRFIANAAPLDTTIFIDHSRHLNPKTTGTRIYLNFDESFGRYAYDISAQSNNFNMNHFFMKRGVSWSSDIPTASQLSYFGITDALGNYTVSGITYSGNGENFTVIPSYLTHSFTPNSRSLFIGDASMVFNNQDFIDNSSFTVSGDLFYKNTTCPVPDGLLKIDGMQHFISIERFENYMEAGRFPITGTYDFHADVAGIHFIDSTLRSIVGRVVGGLNEADKAPGMGRSKNNIGVAKVRIVSPIAGQPCYSAEVTTNASTGEYLFNVPPLEYRIDSVYVLSNKFVLNGALNPSPFTNTKKIVDLRNAFATTKVIDTLLDVNGGIVSIDSIEFHKRHDMIYRITPTVDVTDTLDRAFVGEDSLKHGTTTFFIRPTGPGWGPLGFPVFMQGKSYKAKIHANEIYTNSDNAQKDTVRLSGNVLVTNALVDGTDPNSKIELENGVAYYPFVCGAPNTSTNVINPALDYTKSIQFNVVPAGASTVVWQPNPSVTPSIYHAYVLGQRIAGTGIATLGPEKVDFILRDPPGSGSSSSWTTGTSVSISKDYSRATSSETNVSATLKMGTKQSVGFLVESEVEVDNSIGLGINTVGTNASGRGWTETMTSSYSVSTRDDADNVGAPADIFIGRSRNWLVGPTLNIELIDAAQCLTVGGCFGPTVSGKRMVKKAGYAIAPGDVKTRFSYTQEEIETVVIPTLESLRATKLVAPKYTVVALPGSPGYGSNNDDPLWGALATSTNPDVYEPADANGPSYIYHGSVMADRDTVRIINTQISLWKKALAQNEREKLQCITNTGGILIDNFTLGSAIVTNSYSTDREARSSKTWELSIGGSINLQLGAVFGGIGAQFEESISITETSGGEESKSTTNSSSFEYTLTDGDPGDIMSIDVYKSPEGTGNIFVTRGGYTMCPYEDAVVSHYYNPATPNGYISSHTYNAAGYATIQLATVQREIPEIAITPSNLFSIPSNQPAVFQLLLTNQSPLVVNNDIDFSIRVASASNPFGAVVKIDGLDPNRTFNIPAGSSVVKTLTVERGAIEINYDSLMIIFSSACSEDIADTAYISAHFIPTCTELNLSFPANNWVINNSHNNTGNIIVNGYNYNYGAATDESTNPPTLLGLNNITVELRPNSTNVWTPINTFYKYPDSGQDTIPNNQVYSQYLWDVSDVPDGAYELKAVSYCLNKDGSFSTVESPINAGVMDRINPHPFGTPSPADGILDPNDDISIKFNEPIDIGSISNMNFDVRGVLNGGNIRHYESLLFDGATNYAEVSSGASLQKRDFTFEFWAKLNATGITQTVISQGTDVSQNLVIGFNSSNQMVFAMGAQSVATSTINTPTQWHHYAAAYNYANQTVELYQDGILMNSATTTINSDYSGTGKLVFGKTLPGNSNFFNGNLHDVRLWNSTRTLGSIVQNFNVDLNRSASGLLYNWKMDEAEGLIAKDYIRSRNADLMGATWAISPSGHAAQFDGVNDYLTINSSTVSITKEMDFTLEFWFKSNQPGVATLFSNGKGDGVGADSLVSWNIQKDASGKIHVFHKGYDFVAASTDYFDGNWHHFALIMQRSANLSCYVDGNLQNSVQALSFQQMGSPFMYLGARGYYVGSVQTFDSFYQGQLDEFRFWNTARKVEQVKRDKQNRLLGNEFALQAYLPFESYNVVLGVPVLGSSLSDMSANSLAVANMNGTVLNTQTPTIKIPRPIQSISYTYSINNDQIIITPTTSPERIENVTIDITVKDIYDLKGNKMQSPKTWIAFINKNQVLWVDDELEFSKKSDSTITFTTQIINTGGALKEYTIAGLPAWMTCSQTTGTIAPNSAKNVTFTIPAGTTIGEYSADVTLTTDFGYDEILKVNLRVLGNEPKWIVNPSAFQYSMSIFGELKIDGVISTNINSKIAAFIGDTLCGTANLKYLPTYDRYQVFLNVYSNNVTGDSVRFQIYDASTGIIFVNVSPVYMFVVNDVKGTVNAPVTFVANSDIQVNIAMRPGWTWFSLPLNSNQLQHANALMNQVKNTQGDVIRSASAYDQFSSSLGWLGNISSSTTRYTNAESYRMRRSIADTLHLVGLRIHPDSARAAITVVPGWNWIGYVATKNTDLNTALSGYAAQTGDLIKSQFEFAYYDNSLGWIGSLTTMRPGMGYMLKSAGSSTFRYPQSVFFGNTFRTAGSGLAQTAFTFQPEQFEKSMTVIVSSNLCNQVLQSDEIALGAFDVLGNLRGYALPKEIGKSHQFYLTVYSNMESESLQLSYFHIHSGEMVQGNKQLTFVSDALEGTPADPYQVSVAESSACRFISEQNNQSANWTVYPNPFQDQVLVSLNKEVSGTLQLIDGLGTVRYSIALNGQKEVLVPVSDIQLAAGVYTLRISGDMQSTKKLIKTTNE